MSAEMIWKTLSAIDVSEHVEKKGNLSYLSWAWAWGTLMKHYPMAGYQFRADEVHPDGTVTVHCEVEIHALRRTMWLPVMDHKNKPISNPNSFDINSSKMRCLTKCMAMFGLGHYIYAGEDLPEQKSYKEVCDENDHSIMRIKKALIDSDLSTAAEEWFTMDQETMGLLWKAPKNGGCFTTKEREVMKSTEFRQAYYGEEKIA